MAVVAGVVFFTVRALLALIPALPRFIYCCPAGDVATQRSFFMTAGGADRCIVDRRAATFRTLAALNLTHIGAMEVGAKG
jgi:competence protein ComEC